MESRFFIFLFIIGFSTVLSISLNTHIPERYTDVYAGDKLYFDINVNYPENPQRKDLRFEYEVLTQEEDVLTQAKALKAVKTEAEFVDTIDIPKSALPGFYFLNIRICDYEVLSEEIGVSFYIVSELDENIIYIMIVFGVLILIAGLLLYGIVRDRSSYIKLK